MQVKIGKLEVDILYDHNNHNPVHLFLGIGNEYFQVKEYRPYTDEVFVSRLTKKFDYETTPDNVMRWGIDSSGQPWKKWREYKGDDLVRFVEETTSQFGIKKVMHPFFSCTNKGYPFVTDGRTGYELKASPQWFCLQSCNLIRKNPFTGPVRLNMYGCILITVEEIMRKMALNLETFADPFVGTHTQGVHILKLDY